MKEEKLAAERERLELMREFEHKYGDDYTAICGIDEAGRGPLAGPVVAGAVILPKDCEILYLNDSKKLSEKRREALYDEIVEKAVAYSIGYADHAVIDEINILQATYRAMRMAVENLYGKDGADAGADVTGRTFPEAPEQSRSEAAEGTASGVSTGSDAGHHAHVTPDLLLNDAVVIPGIDIKQVGIVHGDARSVSIAAASILAKVTRDRLMAVMDSLYPLYGFAKHKGYGTREHIEAIRKYGPCPIHRRTFITKFI